jgi:predicted metal-dependent peptidase
MFNAENRRLDKMIALLSSSSVPSVRYFGIQAASMIRSITTDYKTMATDAKHLWVNPDWLNNHTDGQCLFVLVHEAFHKSAKHSIRLRDLPQNLWELWHIACDYAVNLALTLDESIPYKCPEEGLLRTDFVDGEGKPLNAERILRILMDEQQQQQQQVQERTTNDESFDSPEEGDDSEPEKQDSEQETDSKENDNGTSDSSDSDSEPDFDSGDSATGDSETGGGDSSQSTDEDGSELGTDDTDSEIATGELLPAPEDYDESEADADTSKAEALARSAGDLPSYIKESIKGSMSGVDDPLQQLQAELSKIFDKSDYSLRKPNHRYAQFGAIAPSLRSPGIRKIGIARDTSGSMSNDELVIASRRIKSLVDQWMPLETIIVDHDSRLLQEERLCPGQQPQNIDAVGRGGTYFTPVIDLMQGEQVDALIWLTDCMPMDRPEEPDYPVVFMGLDPWHQNYWKRYLGWGRYIEIT